jgi:amidohydrolase
MVMDPVLKLALGHKDRIVEWRRSLHRIPELAYKEEKTSGLLAAALEEMGLDVREGVAGTGVVALLKGGKPGKVVALRADMDALPLEERTDLPFASVHEGRMHACGHDSHMAMVLGAARVLKDVQDELPGQVKLIFQPAEEEGHTGGAKPLIEAGVLEDPKVDYIFGLHVWSDLESGKIGYNKGALLASTDTFYIIVKGRGGHGAKPHDAVDPIVAASHLVVALQSIASREMDPLEPFVLTVGKFQAGTVHNIIPSEALLEGTIRTVREDTRKAVKERLEKLVADVTSAFRAAYELRIDKGYPPTVNDLEVTERAVKVLEESFGPDAVVEIPPVMGGEDFSRYLEHVPGTFLVLGTRNEEKGLTASIHSPYFQVDEDVLPLGSAALAKLALTFGG